LIAFFGLEATIRIVPGAGLTILLGIIPIGTISILLAVPRVLIMPLPMDGGILFVVMAIIIFVNYRFPVSSKNKY
jgi:hypothetical protein